MATKQELEVRVLELEKLLADDISSNALKLEVSSLNEKLLIQTDLAKSLFDEVASLKQKPSEVDKTDNIVVLDGVRCVILEINQMKEMVDRWRKRHVNDDDTCLIVKKT